MSSDIPDKWYPKTLPLDQKAAAHLGAWVTASSSEALPAAGFDLRGANLSGGNFTGAWFSHSILTGVSLAGAELWRAHLEKADLTGANLAGAGLVKATLDEASLRSACLDSADLTSASVYGADAREATFRNAEFPGTSLLRVDLRGADLSGATMANTSFKVRVDEHTVVRGLSGTLLGPVTLVTGNTERELDGPGLEKWLTERGAQVEVLTGQTVTYYAVFSEMSSREDPEGVMRRRVADGIEYDEAFTRNLRWEPTEYFELYYLGHNEDDHVEITRAEVDAFIERVKHDVGSPSQES